MNLHASGMTLDELRLTLQKEYGLINAVADQIEFVFKTKAGSNGNKKEVRIDEGGK